jgi:hypothetical protein
VRHRASTHVEVCVPWARDRQRSARSQWRCHRHRDPVDRAGHQTAYAQLMPAVWACARNASTSFRATPI